MAWMPRQVLGRRPTIPPAAWSPGRRVALDRGPERVSRGRRLL